MAYAEKKAADAALRAAGNGQSAGRRKPPQRLNGKHLGPGEDTVYSRSRKSAEKYWETRGAEDIESFTDSEFRKATSEEIADEETEGYIMGLRLDSGGSKVFNVLSESAYIEREAYLRAAEDGDNGVIYVQNAPYTKEQVKASGTYEESDVTGGKRYTFKQRGSTYISYGDHDVALSGNYRIKYTKSSSGGLKMSAGGAVYYNLSSTGGTGKDKITLSNGTIVYANKIEGPLYGDYKRSTIEVQKIVNGEWTSPSSLDPGSDSVNFYFYIGEQTNVGHVRVIASIAPDLSGKVLVPAKLQKETTREIRYAPWRYIPSQKTQQKKTFLVQGASTAVQNFAFDGMDDID